MYATTDLDQEKAWLRQAVASGDMAGLGDPLVIPHEIDTKYFRDALRDPKTKPYVLEILRDPNPVKAFDAQSQQDLSEAVHSTGKVIVFKALVAPIAARLHRVSEAITASLPTANTEAGRLSIHIADTDPNAESELTDFYTHVALDAFDPAAYDQVTQDDPSLLGFDLVDAPMFGYNSHVASALGDLGLSKKWRKRLKRIKKVGVIVGVAVAAVAATVVTGGAAMGAMAAVAGVAGTALKTFGHTKKQRRIGGYIQAGAAVAGAAAAVVGAAGAISNAVSPATAPAAAPSGGATSYDQAVTAGTTPPAASPSGDGTSYDQGLPGVSTTPDQVVNQQQPSSLQPPSYNQASPTGSVAQAIGSSAGAAGAVLHAIDATQQPAGGGGGGGSAPGASGVSQAGMFGDSGAMLPVGIAVVLAAVLFGGGGGSRARRNPPRRQARRKAGSRSRFFSRR